MDGPIPTLWGHVCVRQLHHRLQLVANLLHTLEVYTVVNLDGDRTVHIPYMTHTQFKGEEMFKNEQHCHTTVTVVKSEVCTQIYFCNIVLLPLSKMDDMIIKTYFLKT